MSYTEDQPWFGLENQAIDTFKEQEENSYYIALLNYQGHKEYLIDYPFSSIEKARRKVFTFKGICKKVRIYYGKPW